MNEDIKIVQFVQNGQGGSDFCLDDKGNVYKIEYNKRNELTLIKQKVNVITPSWLFYRIVLIARWTVTFINPAQVVLGLIDSCYLKLTLSN